MGRLMCGHTAVAKVGIVVCVLLCGVTFASGSHFRYGTLNYHPVKGLTDNAGKQVTEIGFNTAFRRNYNWGEYAGEEWAQLTNADQFTKPAASDWKTIGRDGASGVNSDPHFDEISSFTNDWNQNGIAGEKFFVKFPPFNGFGLATGEFITVCPNPFYCDVAKPGTDCTTADCYDASWNPSLCAQNNGNDYTTGCAAWDQQFGMYMGDGQARTVELTITQMDYSCSALGEGACNSITGNFVFGSETFEWAYEMNTATPYTMYFTGGQRIYECAYGGANPGLTSEGICEKDLDRLLNNNAEGRYRLTMEIWILGDFNRSPIASQLPVLPVVRAESFDTRRVFQIAAYDEDVEDYLIFAFGDSEEMGGITRSKSVNYPWLNGIENTQFNQYGHLHCKADNRVFLETGKCPDDRVPTPVVGTDDSFQSLVDGLVSWRTYYDDGTPLPVGLYNMVVMIHDYQASFDAGDESIENAYKADAGRRVLWKRTGIEVPYKSKVPLDFMLYLYDGPLGFCNKACKDNKDIDIESSLLGTSNPPSDNNYPGYATFADKDGIYGYETPLQVAATYAYPPASAAAPFTGLDRSYKRFAQRCTICGTGGNFNVSMCTPFEDDGVCGKTEGTSVVPTDTACKVNQPPQFSPTELVGGKLSNPLVNVYFDNLMFVNELHNPLTTEENCGYTYSTPVIEVYKGSNFDFFVTANDTDDCTELSLRSTGLPASQETLVYGKVVPANSATFGDDEVLVDNDLFPEGMVLRKRFLWEAPAGSGLDPNLDTRPETSKVCFYAYDKYLVTNQPFYCLVLKVVYESVIIQELEPCMCRTCTTPGYKGFPQNMKFTPNYAPKSQKPVQR